MRTLVAILVAATLTGCYYRPASGRVVSVFVDSSEEHFPDGSYTVTNTISPVVGDVVSAATMFSGAPSAVKLVGATASPTSKYLIAREHTKQAEINALSR